MIGSATIVEASTREVPLTFDPVTRKLFGEGFEPDRAPLPGGRRPRRNGLTTVVEALMRMLRSDAQH